MSIKCCVGWSSHSFIEGFSNPSYLLLNNNQTSCDVWRPGKNIINVRCCHLSDELHDCIKFSISYRPWGYCWLWCDLTWLNGPVVVSVRGTQYTVLQNVYSWQILLLFLLNFKYVIVIVMIVHFLCHFEDSDRISANLKSCQI